MEIIVVVGILAVLEVILSVDNALILGLMVQGLPSQLRRKALFYGIVGAYVLRGLALTFAAFFYKVLVGPSSRRGVFALCSPQILFAKAQRNTPCAYRALFPTILEHSRPDRADGSRFRCGFGLSSRSPL